MTTPSPTPSPSRPAVLQGRHEWVDAAKAISITLVVLTHAATWLADIGIDGGLVIERINFAAAGGRMPLFFLASGLFAGKWLARDWRDLVNRKLAVLSWAFLAWQLVMFGYKYTAALLLPGQENASLAEHLMRMLAAPVRPNAELWFLWALVVFFAAAKLIRAWPRRWALAAAAALSIAWSGVVMPALGPELLRLAGPGLSKFPCYFVFFLAGATFSAAILDVGARARWWQGFAVMVVWVVVIGIVNVFEPIGSIVGVVFVEQIAGVIGGAALAVVLAPIRAVRSLGQRTLPVYLSHTTFIVMIACALHLTGVTVNGAAATALALVGAVLASVLLGLALHRRWGATVLFNPPSWFQLRS